MMKAEVDILKDTDKWKEDFEKIKQGKTLFISDEYFNEILRVYPKLEDRLRSMFHRPKNEQ